MRLNEKMVTAVTADDVINQHKIEDGEMHNQNAILKAQISKQQALIRYLFNKAPEAFPDDYILKEETNVKNK